MFNMKEIGRRIAKLRKDNNLTQVELADKLGISYQAVSNWERGDSMPDISKLSELSRIFKISIDELLGNKAEALIVNKVLNDEVVDFTKFSNEELEGVLPIVKPNKISDSFNEFQYDEFDFEQLIILAPFLEQEKLDEIVLTKYKDKKISEISALAVFVSEEVLWKIVDETLINSDNYNEIVGLLPFLEDKKIDSIFEKLVNDKNSIIKLAGFYPFISEEVLEKLALKKYEEYGINEIMAIIPFVSREVIKIIYDLESKKGNFKNIAMLIPFL